MRRRSKEEIELEAMIAHVIANKVRIALLEHHLDGSDVKLDDSDGAVITKTVRRVLRSYVKSYKED